MRSGALVQRRASDTDAAQGSSRWSTGGIWMDASILEGLPQPDRARWLLQRVNEEVEKGSIGVIQPTRPNSQPNAAQASGSAAPKHRSPKTQRAQPPRQIKGELPSWARGRQEKHGQVKEIDPTDPLGLVKMWEGWGQVVAWGVGSGVVVGAVWVVVIRGWVNGWIPGGERW